MRCKSCNYKVLTRYDFVVDPTGELCAECMSNVRQSLEEFKSIIKKIDKYSNKE